MQIHYVEALEKSNKVSKFQFLLQQKLHNVPLSYSSCCWISEYFHTVFDSFAPLRCCVLNKDVEPMLMWNNCVIIEFFLAVLKYNQFF